MHSTPHATAAHPPRAGPEVLRRGEGTQVTGALREHACRQTSVCGRGDGKHEAEENGGRGATPRPEPGAPLPAARITAPGPQGQELVSPPRRACSFRGSQALGPPEARVAATKLRPFGVTRE